MADFTYVRMAAGFGYTAFVIDAYAGVIIGWECSLRKDTGFVERALRHAAVFRARQGHPFNDAIHHSDAGRQYTAIHFTESLTLAGLKPSIGTIGDALDNGLAETTIGLYKTECIREESPFRSGPIRSLADLNTSPPHGSAGITRPGLCTGLAGVRPPKPRLSTTRASAPTTTPGISRGRGWFSPSPLNRCTG